MRSGKYHLVGVAGVGMNPLAQAIIAGGHTVTGSDRYADQGQDLEVLIKLQGGGVRIFPQDGSGIDAATTAVVVSTAIEKDNPDLVAAARSGVPVIHRAAMLAELVAGHACIAIAGTSGKTTVTGMAGYALEQLGADPTVVDGGAVINWIDERHIGNVRRGAAGPWVIEADESDRSFLNFSPDWAVITNMSADHFDMAETVRLFDQFRARVRTGIVDGSEPALFDNFNPELSARAIRFKYGGVDFEVPVPGRHNAENALQTAVLCERLGYPLPEIARALAGFRGIQRRLELIGRGAVAVYDDYAHNPAKIAAAWRTLKPHYRRMTGVWRPHGFGPLRQMMDDLVTTFGRELRGDDQLHVLPVYYAGGTADNRVNSDTLVERLRAAGVRVHLDADFPAAESRIAAEVLPGDAVIVMGARDPELPRAARRLAARLA